MEHPHCRRQRLGAMGAVRHHQARDDSGVAAHRYRPASIPAYPYQMPESELEHMRAEHEQLRARVEAAEAEIATLRAEAVQRRAEVRAMAESLPAAVSRRALVRAMFGDLRRKRR
jgi:multidrug resistance efflux pump